MTTTRKALGETPDGNHVWDVPDAGDVPAWDPDAIARRYAEGKANIADENGTWAEDADEAWPATEKIDVHAAKPSVTARTPDPEASPDGRPRWSWRRWLPGR